jgi:hypothetical protein
MAIAAAVQYQVQIHADSTGNIVFDDIIVTPFNDGSFGVSTAAVTTIRVGDSGQSGKRYDVFNVVTQYPKLYAGTDPNTLRVNDHIIAAYNAIQAVVTATPYVGFAGGGPAPVLATVNTLVGGTNYPNGTWNNVKLTGGSGYGATATLVVAGGAVTTVTLANKGENYVVGDVLSANLGDGIGNVYPTAHGSGFSVTVASVASPLTNTTYA